MNVHDQSDENTATSLTVRYLLALVAVALLSMMGQGLIQHSLSTQYNDSRLVNLAGRQRMLSQRIAKAALALTATSERDKFEAYRAELREVLAEWRAAHTALESDGAGHGLPHQNSTKIDAMFQQLAPEFNSISHAAEHLADAAKLEGESAPKTQPWVESILAHEGAFLSGMDAIVLQYQTEAESRVARLRYTEAALLICTLLVLAAEGYWVFRPTAQKIRTTLEQRARAQRELETRNRELQQAVQAAEYANQCKSQFLANVSHEIRTPIHSMIGANELLLRRELSAAQRDLVQTAHNSGQILLQLVNDILDMSKIGAGKVSLNPVQFSPRKVITDTVRELSNSTSNSSVRVTLEIDDTVPDAVIGDSLRFRQVLSNIVGNAYKFTEHGEIQIQASRTHAQRDPSRAILALSVRDTGVGIPASAQERIFLPFEQADSSASRQRTGIGLGLAICRELVALMGGDIGCESEPGRGSRFYFTVNFAAAEPVNAPAPQTNARPELTLVGNVLVVDDNPVNQKLIAMQLETLGCKATIAPDGASALQRLEAGSYALVLLDCQMPGIDGYACAREIRKRGLQPRPWIIAVTAHALSGERERCLAAGMDDYVCKPVSIEVIAAALARAGKAANEASIDWRVIERLKALESPNDPNMTDELIEHWIERTGAHVAAIASALAAQDWPAIKACAHDIKSGSSALGFRRISMLGERLEALCRASEPGAQTIQMQEHALKTEYERVRVALEEYRESQRASIT